MFVIKLDFTIYFFLTNLYILLKLFMIIYLDNFNQIKLQYFLFIPKDNFYNYQLLI